MMARGIVAQRRRRPQEALAGLGDYAEPSFYPINPGGLRPLPPQTREAAYANPLQVSQGMNEEAYKFQWTRETPFDGWEAFAYVLGAVTPIRIDLPLRRPRRAVLVTNSSLAANVWIGPSESVRVNNGLFIPPQGSVSIPLNENCRVFAIGSAAGIVVSICQFV
jgi:hypothetical protein